MGCVFETRKIVVVTTNRGTHVRQSRCQLAYCRALEQTHLASNGRVWDVPDLLQLIGNIRGERGKSCDGAQCDTERHFLLLEQL